MHELILPSLSSILSIVELFVNLTLKFLTCISETVKNSVSSMIVSSMILTSVHTDPVVPPENINEVSDGRIRSTVGNNISIINLVS